MGNNGLFPTYHMGLRHINYPAWQKEVHAGFRALLSQVELKLR